MLTTCLSKICKQSSIICIIHPYTCSNICIINSNPLSKQSMQQFLEKKSYLCNNINLHRNLCRNISNPSKCLQRNYRNPLSAKSTAIHAELPANIKKQSMKQCLPKSITIHAAMSADASNHLWIAAAIKPQIISGLLLQSSLNHL